MRTLRHVVAGLTTLVVSGALVSCADAARGPTELVVRKSPVANAASTFTTNESIPITIGVNACGQFVVLSGDLHLLTHVTISASGSVHVKQHAQPQGISGTSAAGVTYHGTGVTQFQDNIIGPPPFTTTFINNFKIIGEGTADNFLVHTNFHVTVNANGEVTTVVDNTSVECRG